MLNQSHVNIPIVLNVHDTGLLMSMSWPDTNNMDMNNSPEGYIKSMLRYFL